MAAPGVNIKLALAGQMSPWPHVLGGASSTLSRRSMERPM